MSPSPSPGFGQGFFYWNPLSVAVKTRQYTRDGVDRVWQGLGRVMGITESQLPCPPLFPKFLNAKSAL
jgi:hypothetical protein